MQRTRTRAWQRTGRSWFSPPSKRFTPIQGFAILEWGYVIVTFFGIVLFFPGVECRMEMAWTLPLTTRTHHAHIQVLSNLAFKNTKHKATLSKAGAVQMVVSTMSTHLFDGAVQLCAVNFFRNLTAGSEIHRAEVAQCSSLSSSQPPLATNLRFTEQRWHSALPSLAANRP
jgi:hypothetical protein